MRPAQHKNLGGIPAYFFVDEPTRRRVAEGLRKQGYVAYIRDEYVFTRAPGTKVHEARFQ
jgi:Mn-dependent DtxR family transcriptional regulator